MATLVSDFIQTLATTDLLETKFQDVGVIIDDGTMTAAQTLNVNTLLNFIYKGLINLYSVLPIKISVYEDSYNAATTYDDLIVLPESCLNLQKITDLDLKELPLDSPDYEYKLKNKLYKGILFKTVAINKFMADGYFDGTVYDVLFHYYDSPCRITLKDTLAIPPSCEDALLYYVAYRAYDTTKKVTQVGDTSVLYKQKFDLEIKRLKNIHDLYLFDFDPDRLGNKGFV